MIYITDCTGHNVWSEKGLVMVIIIVRVYQEENHLAQLEKGIIIIILLDS